MASFRADAVRERLCGRARILHPGRIRDSTLWALLHVVPARWDRAM